MKDIEKTNILLVDDRPENLVAIEGIVDIPNINFVKATSGNKAIAFLLEYDFALVLLDVQMPEMDGFETAKWMRSSKKTMHIPIVFITANDREQKRVLKGYEAGAVDYLFKPLVSLLLIPKIIGFFRLFNGSLLLQLSPFFIVFIYLV